MNVPIYSKCGTTCSRCPSFKTNLKTADDRKECSEGWFKYHGFRLNPEKLIACDGCQPIGKQDTGKRYISCIIRRCAMYNDIETCAHCSAFPCDALQRRSLGKEWVARQIDNLGKIPDNEYAIFMEPYIVMPHLQEIREALEVEEICEVKVVTIDPKLKTFPEELKADDAYRKLHCIIESLNPLTKGLTFAQAEIQKERRTHLLKILWAFGLYGKYDQVSGCLILGHSDFLDQKIHSSYKRITSYFESLEELGILCAVIPLVEDEWKTPKGALRRQGIRDESPPWEMKLTFEGTRGGSDLLHALQTYVQSLHKKYGTSAFRRYKRADMTIMIP